MKIVTRVCKECGKEYEWDDNLNFYFDDCIECYQKNKDTKKEDGK